MGRYVVGITGSSGLIYGVRLTQVLSELKHEVYVIVSDEAKLVADYECLNRDKLNEVLSRYAKKVFSEHDFTSPLASSSFLIDGVVVAPCSLKSLAEIANSIQSTLIVRSTLNALRLKRKVVLLVRDTPLSTLDLINMLKASIAGAVIMPASPGFYSEPSSMKDLIDFIVGKILDVLEIPNDLYRRWSDRNAAPTRSNLCDQFF
ncbi:MAG: hypothetical protein B7O98_02555 [Zestosphaera tikiterensis]|uniref:Flavin prenyltransferase UbiX n=1 Tax=Zestosphaera tikiterensis TaxID=1973259 RepID=A0A2R7Y7N3_9CREN|nr:MAG: hypothetical protein B7O98_02555 [Zestosphaera tikiterensis]